MPLDQLPPSLRQGSIVWANIPDPQGGNIKRRPLVIITSTEEILLDGPVVAVAVTSTLPQILPVEYVELPWDRQKHRATGLSRRSAVVCNWLVEVLPSQVDEIKGFVPTKDLLNILQRIGELNKPTL